MSALNPADAAFVRDLVYKRSAILLDTDKEYLITSRLQQVVAEGAAASITELVSKARNGHPAANTRIVEAITTHETLFFRDAEPFEVLRKEVLPALATPGRRLQIWSAACSSGQEPYSLAMMLTEHFPRLLAEGLKIVATDLSAQVLEKARQARFRQLEVNRGLPASYLVKYFDRDGVEWVVKPEVRKLVEFRQLNLAEPWQLNFRPDLVLLRNVLIYFDQPTKRAILDRVRNGIAPDGALFLGAAETTLNIHDGWDRVASGKTAYYRVRR